MENKNMSNFKVYEPAGVVFPVRLFEEDGYGDPLPTIENPCILLYDAFIDQDGKHITALASTPAKRKIDVFLKFRARLKSDFMFDKSYLSYPQIFHAGCRLKYKVRELKSLYETSGLDVYKIPLTPAMRSQTEIELKFVWGDFSRTVKVVANPLADLNKVRMTLLTQQQDNQLIWLHDWCLYHHREHGVERIAIYDNGSVNRSKIIDCLRSVSREMEILFINWPYHCDEQFADTSHFEQIPAFSHCGLMSKHKTEYYLVFDIDEYIINTRDLDLYELLEKQRGPRVSSFTLSPRQVSRIVPDSYIKPTPARASDFRYVEAKITKKSWKNIAVEGHFSFLKVHRVPEIALLPDILLNIIMLFDDWLLSVHKILAKLKLIRKRRNLGGVYFYHYHGLTTAWKIHKAKNYKLQLTKCKLDKVMHEKLRKHDLTSAEAEYLSD